MINIHTTTTLPEQQHVLCAVCLAFYYGSFSSVIRSAGFAGASLCGNETAGSIIRSDGKSLCKVFCIITYQSQNSHPQILWVTKHQQLPHYCPPKSSPTNDKARRRRSRRRRRTNLILGGWIFIPKKSKEDYCQTDNLFTHSWKVQRAGQGSRQRWVLHMGASWIGFSMFHAVCSSLGVRTLLKPYEESVTWFWSFFIDFKKCFKYHSLLKRQCSCRKQRSACVGAPVYGRYNSVNYEVTMREVCKRVSFNHSTHVITSVTWTGLG